MLNFLRQLKATYALYNVFQYKKLKHNIPLFKKYGVRKKYFSSISSKDFDRDTKVDSPDLSTLLSSDFITNMSPKSQESLQTYNDNGYMIWESFLSAEQVDEVNQEVERLLNDEGMKMRYGGRKLMFAYQKSAIIEKIGRHQDLSKILDVLLVGKARLFQSINFVGMGSEQMTHSDSIHMTTFPLGGLLGVWIALEDIDERNGALHYYPGSHKLPYYLNEAFDNEGSAWKLGDKDYTHYEKMIEDKLANSKFEKKVFRAKKGDLLIWHANLLHGGEPHVDQSLSRKSMVFHYFKEGTICYHEISQRPALMNDF